MSMDVKQTSSDFQNLSTLNIYHKNIICYKFNSSKLCPQIYKFTKNGYQQRMPTPENDKN